MNTCLKWFTVERTTGLVMLVTAFLLVFRPFATALDVLEDAWTVTITLSLIRALLLVSGLFLILRRLVNRIMFLLCLMPMLLYAFALMIIFGFRYNIGPFGFIFGLWATGLSIYLHSVRAAPTVTLNENKDDIGNPHDSGVPSLISKEEKQT